MPTLRPFQRLRLAEYESIYINLGSDGRILKSDGWIQSRSQKSARKILIGTAHVWSQLAAGAIVQYYLETRVLITRLYKPYL